jgi:hypothetical protein
LPWGVAPWNPTKALPFETANRALPYFDLPTNRSFAPIGNHTRRLALWTPEERQMRNETKKQIIFRATESEAQQIKENAAASGFSMQHFLLNAALKKEYSLAEVKGFAVPVIAELHRVGNNLNQIAHRENIGKKWSKSDLIMNIERIEEICQYLKSLTAAQL